MNATRARERGPLRTTNSMASHPTTNSMTRLTTTNLVASHTTTNLVANYCDKLDGR